jgi:cytochrome c oxidase assembly protein subunit 15
MAQPATAARPPVRRALSYLVPRTALGFGQLAAVLAAVMWLNIASGSFVRLTDSGLGCPDWPACHGRPVPPATGHAVIEFSNRLIAAVGIGTALLAYVAARRWGDRLARRLALGVAVVTLAQAPLGALTVHFDLNPYLVMSHFLVAIVALALASYLWAHAWPWPEHRHAGWRPRFVQPLALVAAVAGFALLASGTLSTAAGPHAGGQDVRRVGDWWTVTHWHVVVATIFAVVTLPLLVALLTGRGWRPPGSGQLAIALTVLLPAQAFVGEYQRMHQLPWGVVLLHVSIAAAAWFCLVSLAQRLRAPA